MKQYLKVALVLTLIASICAVLIALLAIYRHRSNIERIYNGTENKLWKTKAEKKAELK